LYQFRLIDQFQPYLAQDITPNDFDASFFSERRRLERFVAEAGGRRHSLYLDTPALK
jgi:hypothetical protein